MKNKNLSWVGALFVFALLLWCTAVTPGKVADPATYTCAVYKIGRASCRERVYVLV